MLALTGAVLTLLSPPAPAAAAGGPVTRLVVWGDSMTQVWPGYLADLVDLPMLYMGKGATTVQDTRNAFTAWVAVHENDADFDTTGHICWCGHTNLNGPNSQDPAADYTTIVPALQDMAGLVPAGMFMPIGLTTGPEAPWGSNAYRLTVDDLNDATATAVNERMRAAFPATYAEVRRYLVTDGLRITGIPATAEDEANIAYDFPPRSLRTDNGNPSHLNEPGRRVAAARLDDLLRERGWVAPRSPDRDADGFDDGVDNCPTVANADQADNNGDGVGNACVNAVSASTLDLDMVEGRAGVTFSIALSGPVAITTTVDYETVGTTATSGVDYTPMSGRAVFPPGDQLAYVRIPVATDTLVEPDEFFDFVISNPSSPLSVLQGSGLGTIENDDVVDPLPILVRQVPAPDATGIGTPTNVLAVFSEPVTRVDYRTVQLYDAAGQAVPATVTYTAGNRTATLDPTANLRNDTRYTVKVGPGIRGSGNQPMVALSWDFLTGPPPTVRGTAPAAGVSGVSVNTNLGALFSEAVLRVSPMTFTLTDSTGQVVPAVVTRSGTTNKWILNPNAALARGTRYTATILGGPQMITDVAGNFMTTSSWTFTTAP